MSETRLEVTCQRCESSYLVIVHRPPNIRVHHNHCIFCGASVHSERVKDVKTIDTFISSEPK